MVPGDTRTLGGCRYLLWMNVSVVHPCRWGGGRARRWRLDRRVLPRSLARTIGRGFICAAIHDGSDFSADAFLKKRYRLMGCGICLYSHFRRLRDTTLDTDIPGTCTRARGFARLSSATVVTQKSKELLQRELHAVLDFCFQCKGRRRWAWHVVSLGGNCVF